MCTAVADDNVTDETVPMCQEITKDVSREINDCQVLQSILNDGHYGISVDDRTALESVIATLHDATALETSNDDTDL